MSDDIDDRLRSRFQEAFPVSAQSTQALTDIGPAMGRARFRLRARVVATSTVGVLIVGGAILGVQSRPTEPSSVVVAGPGPGTDSTLAGEPTTTVPADPDSRSGITHPGLDDGGTGFETTSGSGVRSSTSTGVPSTGSDENSGSSGGGSTTTGQPAISTTGPTTTESDDSGSTTTEPGSTTSSTSAASEETVVSDCGSIVVGISGSEVSVVSVSLLAGYSDEVHNPGPEKIEVSFEKESGHCEIEARVIDGELVTEVENED